MMPNFLIVGAAKSGTTSLYRYLHQHPDVFMPEWKEPCFFVGEPSGIIHRVKTEKRYRRLFARGLNHSAVGEASTPYLYDQQAPETISDTLRTVKIIIILRNPVDMSYSLYNHMVRKEGESSATFEEALEVEEKRQRDPKFRKRCYGWHANYYYFHRGLYYHQVERYFDIFGSGNVLIFTFEEFTGNPVGVTQRTFEFLDVDHAFVPTVKVYNPQGTILDKPVFWKDAGTFQKTLCFVFSRNLIRKIPLLLRNPARKNTGPLSDTTAQSLRERFHDDICRLEELIEKDLSAWKKA